METSAAAVAAAAASRTSVRCFGETKFFRQCPRYVVVDAGVAAGAGAPCFCWEHVSQTAPRLEEVAAIRRHQNREHVADAEWAPLGAFLTNHADAMGGAPAAQRHDDMEPIDAGVRAGRLHDLASDSQNVHTAEVQLGVNAAIGRLRQWAQAHGVTVERDLAARVAEVLGWAPSDVHIGALQHLQHCYQWGDDTLMFGTTYPQLASWVWARVNAGGENAALLRERFFEEVFESRGQCLNGNMARLMNVFAAIDPEMSPQRDMDDVMSSQELQARVYAATRNNPLEGALAEVEALLDLAAVPAAARAGWLDAVRSVYDDDE